MSIHLPFFYLSFYVYSSLFSFHYLKIPNLPPFSLSSFPHQTVFENFNLHHYKHVRLHIVPAFSGFGTENVNVRLLNLIQSGRKLVKQNHAHLKALTASARHNDSEKLTRAWNCKLQNHGKAGKRSNEKRCFWITSIWGGMVHGEVEEQQ